MGARRRRAVHHRHRRIHHRGRTNHSALGLALGRALAPAMGSEEILVLYGSQTGNSEGAAQEIASLVPSRLKSPPADGASGDGTPCSARCMQLDDFLEAERANWPRLVVIVCSSYGVGHAPLGAQKFREACDAILERGGGDRFLEGVKFALLGLGDSHYTTFFQNPTTINDAL